MGMLGTPQEFQGNGKEAHIIYRAIFWEALEGVLEHLLDQLPKNCKFGHRHNWSMLRLKSIRINFAGNSFDAFGGFTRSCEFNLCSSDPT